MESSKLGEVSFDEHDIFSPPSFEEEICFDDTLPPIYDDYKYCGILVPPTIGDIIYHDYTIPAIYDDYNDGCDSFTPTITDDYTHMESNDNFMHADHDDNALCDNYIVESAHDVTEIILREENMVI